MPYSQGCEHYTQAWSLLSTHEWQPLILFPVGKASGLQIGMLDLADGSVVACHLYTDALA